MRDEYNDFFEPVGRSTIDRTLIRLKLTRKKKSLFEPRKNTPENKQKQQYYQTNLAPFEAKDLIFIDCTYSVRNMTRSHARSPKGQRAMSENSLNQRTRISTIGACANDQFIDRFLVTKVLLPDFYLLFSSNNDLASLGTKFLGSCINLL